MYVSSTEHPGFVLPERRLHLSGEFLLEMVRTNMFHYRTCNFCDDTINSGNTLKKKSPCYLHEPSSD
jgi:hypothetical protein